MSSLDPTYHKPERPYGVIVRQTGAHTVIWSCDTKSEAQEIADRELRHNPTCESALVFRAEKVGLPGD